MQFLGFAKRTELTDGQISRLVGSTKELSPYKKKLLEFSSLKQETVILSLCTQKHIK